MYLMAKIGHNALSLLFYGNFINFAAVIGVWRQ